jgi:predicted DNA-binding transcriptional regulator YafY
MTGPVTAGRYHAPMARNSELIRQWEILRDIDAARTGLGVPKLAALRHVHQRTIRRDIEALSKAGFPLYDEKVNGTSMWKLRARPFRALEETGLSVTELCALYFSRTMIATLSGAPFLDDVERALAKIERALPAACRKYLDAIPTLVKAKTMGRKKSDERKMRELVARAMDASLTHRRAQMRYHSVSSRRTKEYIVEPLRVSYAFGGIYLTAFVPEYSETRNFALERVRTLTILDECFDPRPLPPEPFANSLGVNSGSPELVEIEFDADAGEYVAEREWHRSQELVRREDGSMLLRLCVCDDRPLRSWILGFGAHARVIVPVRLARAVASELEAARDRYATRKFEMLRIDALQAS